MADAAGPDQPSPKPVEDGQLQQLGKYTIIRRLGSGGMGTVYLARDTDLKRIVALKVLARERAENPVLVRRFKAEGQAAAHLQHRNIVGVFDSGQIDGLLYIALEYVEGRDVLEIIRTRGVIPVRRSLEIIRQVVLALQHASEKQIVHRDIKPSNLLIKADGTVKLADLGLARSIDDTLDTSITRVGTTVGTVDYMSPEQARNSKATDIRSDLYSLGCTWYHMLAGVAPYAEGSVTNKLHAHATAPLPDPRDRNPRIPEGVVAVLHRLMAKSPADRYQNPQQLLEDLDNPLLLRQEIGADVLSGLSVSVDEDSGSLPDVESGQVPIILDEHSSDLDGSSIPLKGSTAELVTEHRPPESHTSKQDRPRKTLPPRSHTEPQAEAPIPPRKAIPKRQALPRRSSEPEGALAALPEADQKSKFQSRKLPPRAGASSDEPTRSTATSGVSIDSDRVRTLINAGIVVCLLIGVIGGVLWYFGADHSPADQITTSSQSGDQAPPEQQANRGEEHGNEPEPPLEETVREIQDASSNLRRTAQSLPGAEDIVDLNSAVGREWLPDWLFPLRTPPASQTPVRIVERTGVAGDQFPDLEPALSQLPAGEVVIELADAGPYELPQIRLTGRSRLTIRARQGTQPVVYANARNLKEGAALLEATGPVVMEGVNLLMVASGDRPESMSFLRGPAFRFNGCTLQSVGSTSKSAVLIDVTAAGSAAQTAVAFENCHFSSPTASLVQLSGKNARMLAGHSLFCSGDAPAVILKDSLAGGAGDARQITLLGSLILSGKSAIRGRHESLEPPAGLQIMTRKGAIVSAGGTDPMLDLDGWPASLNTSGTEPSAAGVNWKSEASTLAGWSSLIRMKSATQSTPFDGESGWKQFWKEPPAGLGLGQALKLPGNFASAPMGDLAGSLDQLGGGLKLQVEKMPVIPAGMVQRADALSRKSGLPTNWFAAPAGQRKVDFDLAKADTLNAFLNDPAQCPEESLVRLNGVGNRTLPAISLKNRSLQIEFVSGEGAPLTIRPQAEASGPWLNVEGGSIRLKGLKLSTSGKDRGEHPLIRLVSGDLSLVQCQVHENHEGSLGTSPLLAVQGAAASRLEIRDSLLSGPAVVLDANLSGGLAVIENSILAGGQSGLSISVSDASRPGQLEIQSSTIGGGTSVFRTGTVAAGNGPAVTVWLSESLLVPIGKATADSVVLLQTANPESLRRIEWWEDAIGRGPRVTASLSTAPGSKDPRDWAQLWGAGHVLRPCDQELGVIFTHPVTNFDKGEPAQFQLNAGCAASRWNRRGKQLGADVSLVGVTARGAAPGSSPFEGTKTTPPARNSPQPPVRPQTPQSVF